MLAWNRKLALSGIVVAVLAALGGHSTCRAGDAPRAEKKDVAKSQPSPAEIGQWIKDLDSDTFATRQTAAEMLYQTGKPAIAAVADAALGKSLEVTMQSVNVLRRLMQSADKETQEAAKDALERLSKTETSAAAPAKEALAPPPAANRAGNLRPFGIGNIQGNIRIFGGGNIQAGGMQVFRIQANGINQNRSVDVDENGKRTHITEDQNGIEVKVTEKVEGKDKTDTFKAKDADELKKKFPEAHKLYEKYVNGPGVGNIQIQAGQAIPIQIGVAPAFGLPAPNAVQPNTVQKQASQQIAEAQKRIAEATENLRKNAGATPNGDDLKRALDQLEEARKELEGARGKLGGG
jgi:hypothetical protein